MVYSFIGEIPGSIFKLLIEVMRVIFLNFLAILCPSRFPSTWRLRGAFLTVTQVRYRGFNLIVALCHLARATSS